MTVHAMSLPLFEELKHYVGLTEEDARVLRELHPKVRPHYQAIVDDFYRHILEHEGTRRILQDPAQVERLKETLKDWLDGVLLGPYDAAYYEKRTRIGGVHVRIGLPQAYVFAAMAHIRQHLNALAVESGRTEALKSLPKILDLELALIAGSYHEAEKYRSLLEQASLAKLGQMAAVVAHEVKNPLAGIGGAIQVIGGHLPPKSPDREIVKEILERIEDLDRIVRDMLLYARPRPPKLAPVRLKALLEETATAVRQDPALSGAQVSVEGEDLTVPADAGLLRSVFLNLMMNAAQACSGKGRVSVSLGSKGGLVRVSVADEGPGIPPEVLDKVFEPFFSTKHKGTGLGLPIARRAVEAHGGTLSASCPASGGTVMTVELPG